MSLKDQALQAERSQREMYSEQRVREKEKSLDTLIEKWEDRWHLKLDEVPPIPDRDSFAEARVTFGDGRGRHPSVTGWMFSIEDVEFIYDKDNGMCVILTCPECGERHADSWYGIASLGERLRKQRSHSHKCHQVAARELAHAIAAATRATNLSVQRILDEALEIFQGFAR